MSDNKTVQTDANVEDFLATIDHKTRASDARILMEMMQDITGHPPKMWGASIVGFDSYHYRYATGREGDCQVTGFSPRKAKMSVYIMSGFDDLKDELSRLGPHKTSVCCLYLGPLSKIDLNVLREIITKSVKRMGEIDHIHKG